MAYKTLHLKNSTMGALFVARKAGESYDALMVRLLLAAGYAGAALVELPKARQRADQGPYAVLYGAKVGETFRLKWRGERDATGAFPDSQAALYNAVSRCEKKTGFKFQRSQDLLGLLVYRLE